MGADHEVIVPVFERLAGGALLLRRHGAGELSDPQAQGRQQLAQRVIVLLRQNLRRGHEGGHIAVFGTVPDERRGDQGLAAADVALDEPVHHRAGVHVPDSVLHGAALRPGGLEGQGRPEAVKPALLHADAGFPRPLAPHTPQGAGEDEELLKDEPPPCQLQRLEIRREVDVLIGVARLRKTAALPHRMGQDVRQLLQAGVQSLAYRLLHDALAQSRGDAVDWHDAPGDVPLPLRLFKDGIDHAAARAAGLDPAEEDVGLAPVKIVPGIGHVEVGDVQRAAVVHRAQLHDVEPPADPRQPRGISDHGLHADALPLAGEGDGLDAAAVLVFPGKKRDKVTQRKDAELVQSLRLFLSDALDISNVGIQISHVSFHVA